LVSWDPTKARRHGCPRDPHRPQTFDPETRWEALKTAIDALVKARRKNARLNVILFETAIHLWQKQLVKVNVGTRGALKKHLLSKRAMGGTNL